MKELATTVGSAEARPSLFEQGKLLLESFAESLTELPKRALDVGDNVAKGIDKTVNTIKWVGIVGGGLAGLLVLKQFLPERKEARKT
jgi:hypothetical protein